MNWGEVHVQKQLRGPTEAAEPKGEPHVFVPKPKPAYPKWMKDPSLLPKRPPGKL